MGNLIQKCSKPKLETWNLEIGIWNLEIRTRNLKPKT